ncbi:MAG: glycosyltransferase, partial [bacterium]
MTKERGKSRSAPRLLFITYFFPPTAGGGVFRPLAMIKYLSRLGWNITVITATTPKHYPKDPALENQIPDNVKVIRLPVVWEGSLLRRITGKLGLEWIPKGLITPDERIFWADKATTQAKKLSAKEHFDCIYTTGPPFSILLTGLWLKRMTKIPWLAEFRDPWTLAPYLTISNTHHRRFADDTEGDLMEFADAVVMVTPTFAKMMGDKYTENSAKVHCVPNGFDSEDFKNIDFNRPKNTEFTIVAAGTVFGRYNMDDFLSGLEKIKSDRKEYWQKIRVKFQGLPDVKLNRRLLDNDLNDRCSSMGFVPHAKNIHDLVYADLLILPLARVANSEGHLPSRTYEYLASGTPILAICPDGDLKELVSSFPQVMMRENGD